MRNSGSRKVVLGLLSFILLAFCLSFPVRARADSATVPWLSGTFSGNPDLFSVGSGWQDYSWWLSFSPNLPDMSGTWYCDENGFCENSGSAAFTGGTGYGEIRSSSNGVLLATFTGEVLGGRVSWYEHCHPDCQFPLYYYNEYYFSFTGLWSNGWLTGGSDYAQDWGPTSVQFDMTTTTPEPGTLALISVGITGVYLRLRRR